MMYLNKYLQYVQLKFEIETEPEVDEKKFERKERMSLQIA